MSVDLHPDVLRAINRARGSALGRRFDRFARTRYGVSGGRLAAKQVGGESGGNMAAVSSAGARGTGQFIPSTRQEMIRRFGIDPWRSQDEAVQALMRYDLERGVAGYNAGMPSYTKYVLGQKLSPRTYKAVTRGSGKHGGSAGSGTPGAPGGFGPGGTLSLAGPTSHDVTLGSQTIPGVDHTADRRALAEQLFLGGGPLNMQKLLAYKQQISSLKDVPAQTVSGDIRVKASQGPGVSVGTQGDRLTGVAAQRPAGTGRKLGSMFRIAQDVDRLNNQGKVPYKWGGGHGAAPAKVGEPVDCSGFVSQILGVAPRVSGDFAASWGRPGRGHWVTVYANPEHVLIAMRDPRTRKVRWFATSRSNPGGGAGEIAKPSAGYLARFTAKHPG